MVKYSMDNRYEAVKLTQAHWSVSEISNHLNISEAVIRRWLTLFSYHGYEGLEMKRRNYTRDFKLQAIHYRKEHPTLSVYQVSAYLGLSDRVLGGWIKSYDTGGASVLGEDVYSTSPIQPPTHMTKEPKKTLTEDEKDHRIKTIEADNERLRIENEFLKKYNALVQKKRKEQNLPPLE